METIIMSVGGSLIVPEEIDTDFLARFKMFVESDLAESDRRYIIITGGGKTARKYQDAANTISGIDNEDLDWLGIHTTRLNAHLFRTIFKSYAHSAVITNPDDIVDVRVDERVVIAAGYRPGASTDLRAVQMADLLGAKKLINLTNTDYVMTADPKTDPSAEKIDDMSWEDFLKLVPEEWDPGLSTPFDPVAAREATENNIEVAAINGAHLNELKKYLNEEPFTGTRIHN